MISAFAAVLTSSTAAVRMNFISMLLSKDSHDSPTIADYPHWLPTLREALAVNCHLAVVVVRQTTIGAAITENPHTGFPAAAIGADDLSLCGSADQQRSRD